ncbi:MAG: acyl-CoA thioesterase [Firmicutes bacterium]|nr:acyl-CoA thioesterase [Bacillota bacterium]
MNFEKPMKESYVEMTEVVLPNDTNPHGTIFGGKVAQWVDIAGSISAIRHCRMTVVTASMGQLDFLSPVKVGQILILRSQVVYVGNTSMEVQVNIFSEDPLSGNRQKTGTAYLTYVALDGSGNRVRVPRLIPETEEEKNLLELGEKIYSERRKQKFNENLE